MPPRIDPANVTTGHVPPQPTSASSARRPLSQITTQQVFRASLDLAAETESPESELPPRELPPVTPSHPTSSSHLPPGNSGLRRQSIRRGTHEVAPSSLGERTPLQPPSMPMITIPQPSELTPPAQTRPRQSQQLAPDGSAGGRMPPPSPHHGSSRDYSTADYPYRFDTMPSPRLDSGPPYYRSADISGGIHANVWPTYNKISQEFDEKRSAKWNADLNVLLIFAVLFSAIVTTFLVRALDDLEPDYQRQTVLLLHQLLNGRDPNLASISDPTIPHKPTGFAIAVNCLWFASLSASLCVSFGALICKEWVTEYSCGSANPVVDLLRACQRQIRFMAFQRWKVHILVTFLSPLLHFSALLFFAGAVIYLWQMDERVAIVYQVIGGIICIIYFISTFLPFATSAPFRSSSTLLFHRLSVAIGKAVIPIVDGPVYVYHLTLRYVVNALLAPLARTTFVKGSLPRWCVQIASITPGKYRHMQVWWATAFDDSLDDINTSQRIQEEAVLWLSQMPLDPSESRAVVSSLALVSSSRPHSFPKPVIVFLNSTLESSFYEGAGQVQTDVAIDCVLGLAHIKFQSVVDQNSDRDLDVGGTPITGSVIWAAQQLTVNAFQEKFNTQHSEGIRIRLLTAAAWLSPVDPTEDVHWGGGEKLEIQGRDQFIQELGIILQHHVHGEKVLDNQVFINLIHGMHASVPRGGYGNPLSTIPFPPALCKYYDSPWSEDESVLRAFITYALDLLSPPERRWPLVERVIKFDDLASGLIDRLMANIPSADVVAFGFWLVYRVPYAFKSRKTMLADIGHIWSSAVQPIEDGTRRRRLNFHAVDAFAAVVQWHVSTSGVLPKFAHQTALRLLNAALESEHSRPMATYAIAMILGLGKSAQISAVTNDIQAESFVETLFSVGDDLEMGMTKEDVVDLRIYSALILLKLRPTTGLDAGKVRELIGQIGGAIWDSPVRDSGVAERPEAGTSADLDRARWKAIYLSTLLFAFVPDEAKRDDIERLQARVQGLVKDGKLPVVGDYECCLRPLGLDVLQLRTPTAEKQGPMSSAFDLWIDGFPLFPLAGSIASAGAR